MPENASGKEWAYGDMVLVEWVDSYSRTAWRRRSELEKLAEKGPMLCRTAGFLVKRTPELIVVAGSLARNGKAEDVCECMLIPRMAVLNTWVLVRNGSHYTGDEGVKVDAGKPTTVAMD